MEEIALGGASFICVPHQMLFGWDGHGM